MFPVISNFFNSVLESERSRWIVWMPVTVAMGIGSYFALPYEPSIWWLSLLPLVAISTWYRPGLLPVLLIVLGFSVILLRVTLLATPQLTKETRPSTFAGTLEKVELRPKDVRLTLVDLTLPILEGKQLKKVRLSCRGSLCLGQSLQPGERLEVRAALLPPQGPAHPYGYDFRRQAYFEGIGALGFIVVPPHVLEADNNPGNLARWRHDLTQFLRQHIGGGEGEIAAALVTGDRSGIANKVRDDFANAGVAHVLAISGLHLSLVAGFFFFFIRTFLAFIPPLALRFSTKKMAAACALLGILGYLAICGAPIPAARSFIMTSLVLIGVMLDRFALSLRNVSIAGTLLLLMMPEALVSPSFQLSFSAVVVLVAGYERYYGPLQSWVGKNPWFGKIFVMYVAGVVLSSLLSTLATTPYVLYTFHRFTVHGIAANMIIIPLISFIIMPALALFLLLWPLSELLGLGWVVKKSIGFMAWISDYVATWEGSNIALKAMPIEALVVMTFGFLIFFLVRHVVRYLGLGLMVIGIGLTYHSPLPTLFISKTGSFVGLYGQDNILKVNTLQKNRFARKSWMTYCGYKDVKKVTTLLEHLDLPFDKIFQETIAQKPSATYVWITKDHFRSLTVQDTVGQRPWSLE